MRKKIFSFLLALVTSVGLSWATDPILISTNTQQSSYTQGDITITCSRPGTDSDGFYLEYEPSNTATITNSGSSTISQIELEIGWFPQNRTYVRANGAESTSSDQYSITFSNVNSNNVTLTITNEKIQIRRVTITLADEGGSAQSGLQVTEFTVPPSWQDNPTMLSTSDMPGFVAITEAEAAAWDAAPAGNVVLIFAFEGDGATSLSFKDGVYQAAQAHNITYEDLYGWSVLGRQIFYTGGGSTPAVDPEPTPSATGGIFANCYDCWRNPPYPTISGQCHLFNFGNPGVGNGNPSGPWKLEFVGNYNSSSTEYESYIVNSEVASEYGKNPEEMEVYRLYQWQNGAYQPVAYGVLYAYANENNPVEHAAFFEAGGYWGCYLTGNTHSYDDNVYVTFNEDASTGFADLHGGSTPAVDPEPTPTPSGDGDKLAGAFSVGGDKVVYFSKANLQATTADNGATWTWGFAENQWDYVGNNAANNAINGGGTVSSNGPVDLFAWSSKANNYFGINNSINEADYSGDFKDWGAKKGSNWRTLTINEWQYLLEDRNPGSSSANYTNYPRYTNAQILTDGTAPQKDIKGIIIFPDDFNDGGESIDGVTWGSINPSFFSSDPTYCTTAGWATLESMGCVFLPSAGSRQNFGDEFAIVDVAIMGNYWSSTLNSGEPEDPQSIVVGGSTLGIGTNPRYFGQSVRLVSETAPSGGSTNPEIKLNANFSGDWEDTEAFTDNGDGTATLTIPSLEAKHNAIFVKKDGVQMSSGHNFTRENPSADVSGNQLAMWFDTDEAGEYTFTFEYSTNILTITYPTSTPTPAPSDDANKLPGAFSVSGTKVVYFSKGNLRAITADNGSTWTWGFAENQYDFIGNAAANNAINGGGTVSTNGAVDLFGWSSNANNYYGIDNSTDLTDYDGNFQDWGAKVGSDWRALNGAQWEYLLLTREPGSLADGTSNPRFTRATILTDGTAPSQDIFGLILFPDNFNDGGEYIDGVTWNGINSHSSYVSPTYCTTAGWATLESMGCVFLPAPGWRSGNEVTNVGAFGIYWSSTKYSEEDASCIYFSNTDVAAFHSYITTGASVRLVSETPPSGGSTPANSCGDGLTWELNEGVLTISYDGEGTGEMYDFGYEYDESPVNVAPWKENKSAITTVIVGDGVKSIGNHAFNDLSENFTAVTIANSVERIGLNAFLNSEEITEITLPSSLKTIDEQGFANCGFTSITIPSGVTSIGYKAFCYCRDLTSLTCEATTPPTLASSVFYKIRSSTSSLSSIPLYVPSGSVTAYEAAAQWNDFDIQGYDPTPAETVTVVFEANNNQKEVEVTLPHTFACDFENGNGELDGIIQELYALQYGGYCQAFNVPTATGNEAVTASKDGNNHYIAISEAFEGTATVTGNYIKYLDTEHMGNTSVDYTLTISVQGSDPAPAGPAYTVAGDNATLFGTTWAPTNTDNDMVKSGSVYIWEKTGVELPAGNVEFKVCQDHSWAVAYPSGNYTLNIPTSGIYTITITFDPNADDNNKVTAEPTKTADLVVLPTVAMHGTFTGSWADTELFEKSSSEEYCSLEMNLAAGNYEFGMRIGGSGNWTANGIAFTRTNASAEVVSGSGNLTLAADIPGNYTFTWTYADNTLSIGYPNLVVYVQNLIAAIGEVTLESGDAINAARTAYDNLLDADQKQAVNNYGVLEAAEIAYAALAQAAADQLAANNVKDLIDAIDNPVVYTQACKDKIDAARAAYDALTDAQKTLVGDEYAQKLADAEAAYDAFIVYTVAGEPEALFGSFWNIEDTNNDMVKQGNGTYKWEKSEVALAAGIAKFKIIKDHVTYEYPTSNYELQIEEDGIYTVTIIYDPKAAEDRITTNALKTSEAVIVHTAEMKGSWNNWTDGLEFENINEGAAARATKILTPGTYEFKMIIDGSWLGEASTTFTRNENAKAEIGGDEDNLKLNADIPGCYTFTWTYETNTLEIGYPNYIDANLAIDFRTNPYSVVSGVEQSASVMVEGSMNTGDAAHGYRLPVISIPVTAGNYKVMMGTCSYSNQDATIKTEDNSYTYATLETNNGTCYHQNTATNVVGAIFNVPSDQIIKVYGAEYTPFFSIEKMAAVPAFTDFEINFQSDPYNVISGAKPDGTVIIGTYHDNLHGYQNVEAVVPVEAGNYRLTVGACQYGTPGNVMSETNAELASFNSNLGEGNCYHNNTAANIVSTIFTVDMDQTITINGGAYMPYMKLEKLLDNTYYINFENAEGAIGTVPGEIAIAAGESWTIPANLTLYKEGYTFVGWSDGVNTYAPGDEFFPNAHGTLQAVYTPNSVSIADASTINVKWYFGESNGAPSVTWNGVAGYLLAKGEVDGELIDLKLDIDATSGKFHNAGRGDKWAQVNANTVFTFPSKEGAVVNVETYSGNETYDLAAGTLTCNTNDYYSYLEIVYPAPTTAVVIGDPNDADQVNAFLTTYDGQMIDELIIDRPVYNNMYNTLCLPFDMNAAQIAASSLNGVEIREFTGASVEGTTLNLSVGDPVNAVVAGRPYFVKYSAASQLEDLHFEDVTINKAILDDEAVTFDGVTFKGTFTPFVMPNGLTFQGGYLFLGQNNQLFWPSTSNPLKPFRAYFYVNVEASTPGNAPKYRGMPARIVEGKNVATGVENAQSANQSTKVIVNGQLIIIKNDVRYNAQGQIIK